MTEDLEKPKQPELLTRTLTAIVVASIAAAAIYQGGTAFYILVFASATLMCFEFDKMRGDVLKTILIIAVPLLLANNPQAALASFALGIGLIFVLEKLIDFSHHWALAAILLVFPCCFSFIWLRGEDPSGLVMILWLVAVVVATDVGAYFIGKKFGKTKLAPAISPNKTREGAAGGLVLAMAASFAINPQISIMLFAALISASAQAGDLLESSIKRHFGVKDSGKLLPGHGGILDRVDGYLLSAPLLAVLYKLELFQW